MTYRTSITLPLENGWTSIPFPLPGPKEGAATDAVDGGGRGDKLCGVLDAEFGGGRGELLVEEARELGLLLLLLLLGAAAAADDAGLIRNCL